MPPSVLSLCDLMRVLHETTLLNYHAKLDAAALRFGSGEGDMRSYLLECCTICQGTLDLAMLRRTLMHAKKKNEALVASPCNIQTVASHYIA